MVTLRSVWVAMEDNDISAMLVELTRAHCKLALEHSDRDTTPERRKAIRAEIERLRAERSEILGACSL